MSRKLIIVFFIIIGTIRSFESIAQFFPDAAVQTSLHKLDSVLKPLVMRHASTLQKG